MATNTSDDVTVDIDILSVLPTFHLGYSLTKSADLPLEIISRTNTAPVFTEGETTTRTVSENTASNSNIGTPVTATDADNDTLTYILSGVDAASFTIDTATGQLKTKATLDYETKDAYTVTIIVSDEKLTDSINVTIDITDIDETVPNRAPVFTEGDTTTRTVAEKTLEGVEIGSPVSATDLDNDTLTYMLGGADAAIFDIESTTGQLKTKKTLDFESQFTYKVTLTVSDSKLSDTIDVTITVTDIDETIPNRAPTFTNGDSTTRTVAENTVANVNIGTAITATDPDGNTLTYTLRGTDGASFAIETATGQLKTKAILNYEAKNSYTVTVTVSDGSLTDTIECTVNITNVNEAPTFTDSESATRTVAENTDVGTNVGTTITATDIDSNDLTYTLGGPDATSFDIEDTTGQLKTNSTFDYESKSTYTVTITVSDGALTDLITVTVNVSNVNEAPVFTEGDSTTRTVAEQTLEGVEIGTPVSATDPDSDTLFYTLGDADAGIFDIESTTGQLKTEKTLDFETQSTYQVTLTVSDSKLTDSIDVTITVTNIDETIPNRAPTFTDGDNTTRSVAENSDAGTDIGTAIVATDPDGNTLIYTLGGTDATSFEIEDATGQLRTKSALDYETKNSYTVTVTVSDGNGGSDSITVTIAITDVDETPPVHTPIGVCDRTPQVRDAIVTAVAVNSCEEVTETHLALISSLYLADEAIASLKDGDFDGLSSLERLNLNNNQLTSLPEDIFDGLSSLEFLSLRDNQLSSLSEDIFDGLSSLDHLRLFGNQLTSLPADLFDGLSSLNELHLNSNQLTSLPEDIFDGLSSLTYLTISSNQLTSIPAKVFKDLSSLEILPLFINQLTNIEAGTFEGLSSIKTLFLNLNPGSPFGFTISLEKVGTNQFKAIMPVGATFSVVIPLSVTNGSINDDITSVTIPVGSVESSLFTVTRTAGTTNAVTVDIGTLPSLPSDHTGYSLVKSNELPLTVIGETGTSNVAPVFTDGTSTSRTIAENSATGTNIGTAVTATDADNDTLTYTLSGTDAASFDIENTTGQLKTRAALDYETENSYTVTVTVSDGSFRDTITVTINVTDITETPSNSAPVFTDGTSTSRTIAENSAADTNIGTAIAATDADDDTLTYTLSGTDAASFDIESTTGQLKTKAILNHESKSSYSVTVTASDNTLTDTIDVTITISDVNEVPVFTDGNETTRMILENTDSGASIGTPISATDEDNDTLTYALGGTDASSFGIDTATGQLKTSTALNHETKDTYSVTVSVADADATIVISVTITVTDKKEAPVFTDGETTTRSVDENTSAGENIGIPVAATDEDNDTLEYALSGTDVSSFSIDTSTGQLKTSAALDYETTSSYSVTVSVTDNKGGTDSISVTISVTDVDEESTTPTFTPVCDRTPQVRDAIVAAAGVHDCSDVTEEHLASISILDLSSKGITSLKAGDFDGLSSLLQLDLDTNDLSSLPSDIFDELTKLNKLRMGGNNLSSLPSGLFDNLTSLTELRLSSNNLVSLPENLFDDNTALTKLNLGHNKLSSLPSGLFDKLTALTELPMSANSLSSLPSGIFDKLTSLTFLNLGNNDFSSLPSGIFDELTALTSLHLHVNKFSSLPSDIFDELTSLTKLSLFHNDFSSLPSDIFDELTSLTKLSLFHNDFSSLPTGLFDGLTSLTTLELNYNTVNPLPLTVSLEKVSDGQFKAVAPIGAPFDIVLPLTVSNGSISGGTTSVTIPIGKVESDTLTVTRTSGTTATVTVDIGTLPSIPSSHNGYSLVKSTDLPLEVISAVSGAPTTVGNDTPQIPVATALLSNYPNPFNPETWIPYQLSNPADVSLTIYDIRGVVVRQLTLGRQSASFYLSRSRAIHWDGRNALGEKVATGLYFYVFKADDYSAKRKMLIRK